METLSKELLRRGSYVLKTSKAKELSSRAEEMEVLLLELAQLTALSKINLTEDAFRLSEKAKMLLFPKED